MNWILLIIGILMACSLMFIARDAMECAVILIAVGGGIIIGLALVLLGNEGNG